MKGRITSISGATVGIACAGLQIGDRVRVGRAQLTGEVVRLERDLATVQVFEETRGLGIHEPAGSAGGPLTVALGPGLLGGVFDGLQRPLPGLKQMSGDFIDVGQQPAPLDMQKRWEFQAATEPGVEVAAGDLLGRLTEGHLEHPVYAPTEGVVKQLADRSFRLDQAMAVMADGRQVQGWHAWPVRRPRPYNRKLRPEMPLVTGQRCIDFLFPLVKGGVALIPGGFGTGKTVLEQTIAKFADVDVVVYVGCGERGNEMAGLLEEFAELEDPRSDRPLMERTIIVANTSNMPVAARESSIFTAVTMAEYYRDMGLDVLFLADSLSRWAEALREISASLEEMPGEDGYPTYLGSRLAAFVERAGAVETLAGTRGSLSMILAVSPPGGDFSEPVTQACLRVVGAYYLLDTRLAHRRHFPAINWQQSYSLYHRKAASHFQAEHDDWEDLREGCRDVLQREEALREIVEVVGMEGLQDQDRLLMETAERIRREFLCQNSFTADAYSSIEATRNRIDELLAQHRHLRERLAEGLSLEEAREEGDDAAG